MIPGILDGRITLLSSSPEPPYVDLASMGGHVSNAVQPDTALGRLLAGMTGMHECVISDIAPDLTIYTTQRPEPQDGEQRIVTASIQQHPMEEHKEAAAESEPGEPDGDVMMVVSRETLRQLIELRAGEKIARQELGDTIRGNARQAARNGLYNPEAGTQ
jgi:hypothetical protein